MNKRKIRSQRIATKYQ